jgi:predicted transposase/invertase (TIGR01784 family)
MESYWTSEKNYKEMNNFISGSIRDSRDEGIEEGMVRGRAEGIEEGMVKGRAEGIAEKARQIALNALRQGYSIEKVSALTGLTLSELAELQNCNC